MLVQIWLWDASQRLRNDQLYRIPAKFRPISTNISDFRSIFGCVFKFFEESSSKNEGVELMIVGPLDRGSQSLR